MPYRNIRIHPVLRLVYFLLRSLGWLGVTVFFRRRIVLGRENCRFDGPAIVVVNHPSTLMDVFNPGLPIRQEMFFLANYGLFKHPVMNWLLTRLFCIPVKRREDVMEGEDRSNDAAFKQSFRHLEKNGVLFIAAEGTSWMNRWVRPFKTGAARIAFGTESRNNWELGIKIVPIGLYYSAPNLFRSNVVVHCGQPIDVRSWAGDWQKNHEKAVNEFTAEVQRRVTALTIHARDEEGEAFIARLEEILENQQPKAWLKTFHQLKRVAETQLDNEALKSKTNRYFELLKSAGVTDLGLQSWLAANVAWRTFIDSFLLVIGFPFFLIGYLFWFLPCYLPWLLNKRLDLYIGYSSTVKMLAGLITLPLALWASYKFLPQLIELGSFKILALFIPIALGFFTEHYMDVAQRAWERLKAGRFAQAHQDKLKQLSVLRIEILEGVEIVEG